MAFEINIHAVGHHLQTHANALHDASRDAYARSAFNRYYYSTFLTARTLLKTIDASWARTPHADYPVILRGKIKKQLQVGWTRARRGGDVKLVRDTEAAFRSIEALSSLLEKAYSIRVVADYEPEEAIVFDANARFSLREIDITSAHKWREDGEKFCATILAAWRQFYG